MTSRIFGVRNQFDKYDRMSRQNFSISACSYFLTGHSTAEFLSFASSSKIGSSGEKSAGKKTITGKVLVHVDFTLVHVDFVLDLDFD